MKGHRRDQSESHVPLRQHELQASFDNNEVRFHHTRQPTTSTICAPNSNGTSAPGTSPPSTCEAMELGNEVTDSSNHRRKRRLATELLKTGIAFMCLSVAAFLNFLMLTVVHDIVPRTERLPDLVFFVVRQQRWAWVVGDVFSTIKYRYLSTPITFLGIAALVVSGGHYTMDVLIAYWLTSHVFWSYHQMFELPHAERAQAQLSRLWWFWLCYWFEQDVETGRMVNEWDWPLPGPQFMHRALRAVNERLK